MEPNPPLRRKREELVREHMDSENRHEFDATIDTFEHPRYELIATGDVYDGTEEVERYFEESRHTLLIWRRSALVTASQPPGTLAMCRGALRPGSAAAISMLSL